MRGSDKESRPESIELANLDALFLQKDNPELKPLFIEGVDLTNITDEGSLRANLKPVVSMFNFSADALELLTDAETTQQFIAGVTLSNALSANKDTVADCLDYAEEISGKVRLVLGCDDDKTFYEQVETLNPSSIQAILAIHNTLSDKTLVFDGVQLNQFELICGIESRDSSPDLYATVLRLLNTTRPIGDWNTQGDNAGILNARKGLLNAYQKNYVANNASYNQVSYILGKLGVGTRDLQGLQFTLEQAAFQDAVLVLIPAALAQRDAQALENLKVILGDADANDKLQQLFHTGLEDKFRV